MIPFLLQKGGAFWLGFNKPQTETIIHYVSSGNPGRMEGEHYCDSPDNLRKIFEYVDPVPAAKAYCVFKPVFLFSEKEIPVLVSFFIRPESLSGLHQLAAFTIPFGMFTRMIDLYKDSFLMTRTWENVHKKISKSMERTVKSVSSRIKKDCG